MRLNQICLDEELQCIALSLIDASYVKLTFDLSKDMLKRWQQLLKFISLFIYTVILFADITI